MNYFASMGTTWYSLNNGQTIAINDISKFSIFNKRWKNNQQTQLQYVIKDGELPHQISNRLYGTVDYWWTILLFNDIIDFDKQWPLSQSQVDDFISYKYPDSNPSDAHHYISPNGLVADLLSIYVLYGATTDPQAISIGNLTAVSIYDYEHALNDLRRNIILIDPDSISAVQNEYELIMGVAV